MNELYYSVNKHIAECHCIHTYNVSSPRIVLRSLIPPNVSYVFFVELSHHVGFRVWTHPQSYEGVLLHRFINEKSATREKRTYKELNTTYMQ